MKPHVLRRSVVSLPIVLGVLAALAALVALASPAAAGVIRVPADQPTLAAAIAAATAGDTVLVAPGTYSGAGNNDLDFAGKDLVLRSEAGAWATTIDCEQAGRAFRFHMGETNAAVVDGFTIKNGKMVGFDPASWGGAIACDESSPTILRCIFDTNTASIGGAMALLSITGAAPAVSDCIFTANSASQQGAGVVCDGVLTTFSACSFTGNTGLVQGGAVMCIGTATRVTGAGCTFTGNSAGSAGGVLVRDGQVTLDDCVLANNTATFSGGGVIASNEARVTLNHCLLYGNGVGAVILRASVGHTATLSLANCTIAGNPSTGLVVDGAVDATIENTIIAFNEPGEAVLCADVSSTVTLRCSDLFGNAGGDWTGCIASQAGTAGNLSADPLFCNRQAGDFHVNADSPCAPPQSGACGLIGAREAIDCPNAVAPATWGGIKVRGLPRGR
jgi:hypothetical protein